MRLVYVLPVIVLAAALLLRVGVARWPRRAVL